MYLSFVGKSFDRKYVQSLITWIQEDIFPLLMHTLGSKVKSRAFVMYLRLSVVLANLQIILVHSDASSYPQRFLPFSCAVSVAAMNPISKYLMETSQNNEQERAIMNITATVQQGMYTYLAQFPSVNLHSCYE